MPPSDPAAVPPRTSCCQHFSDCAQHNAPAEPVGPCDCGKGGTPCGGEPVPPPEWALDAAHEYFSDQWTHLGIPNGIAVNVSPLARLLASVREGALREAAGAVIAHPAFVAKYPNDFANAILSLLHTPPSGGA